MKEKLFLYYSKMLINGLLKRNSVKRLFETFMVKVSSRIVNCITHSLLFLKRLRNSLVKYLQKMKKKNRIKNGLYDGSVILNRI